MDDHGSPLLFSHVPKTGGTSFGVVAKRFTPQASFVYAGELTLGNPNIEFITRFRDAPLPPLLMGHFSYGVHRLIGTAPRYACVFRDPVQRVISLYRGMRNAPDSQNAEFFRENGSLKDWVAGGISEQTNNHMTRICAGVSPDAGMIIRDRWFLECALSNLRRHYIVVGDFDRLDLFAAELGKILGWPATHIPVLNIGVGPSAPLDTETHQIIRDYNALDIELYAFIRAGALTQQCPPAKAYPEKLGGGPP
jgi:hypothetical protein